MSDQVMPASPQAGAHSRKSLQLHLIAGIGACILLIFGFGGWAAVAQLSGAVIAQGTVVVDTDLKKVQHPTGGVVGEILVKDGQRVKANDIVIRLDETVTRANLQIVEKNLDGLLGRRARLEAERDGREQITFPPELVETAAARAEPDSIMTGEQRLLEARRTARLGQQAQLNERIVQLNEEIAGIEAQRSARLAQRELIKQELQGAQDLYEKKLTPLSRLTALQREAVQLDGDTGRLKAAMAGARGRIAEARLQILQLDRDRGAEVLKDLRETETRIGELTERKVAAEDQLKRIDIRSPQDGIVHQLAVHTLGGVIAPGDVLMLIVPADEELAIETRIAPSDIDQVAVGQPAVLRLTAFSQRTTPELTGTVTRRAADLTQDQRTGLSYYTARIELPPAELKRLARLKLMPGMPVEAHIQTGSRSALSYLIKPLSDQISRALRE